MRPRVRPTCGSERETEREREKKKETERGGKGEGDVGKKTERTVNSEKESRRARASNVQIKKACV